MKNKGLVNTWSAAVYGLIVALSYSLATTSSFTFGPYLTSFYEPELLPLIAPMAYVYVAAISAVGMVLFKKLQGTLKRKYVNPAAAAKLLVFLPFAQTVLFAQAHSDSVPLNGPIGYSYTQGSSPITRLSELLVQACFGDLKVRSATVSVSPTELFKTLTLLKYHGWVGGASSIAVIVVGVSLFLVARKYIKWRITLSYLLSVTTMAPIMFAIYGGDPFLRVGFELFIGSSIFLAFFMADRPSNNTDHIHWANNFRSWIRSAYNPDSNRTWVF